jgi:cell division control protein 6
VAIERRSRAAKAPTASLPATPSKSQTAAPTIKTLFDTYALLCTRDSALHPLSSSEFREVIGSLEALSLITPVDGRTGTFAALQATTPSRKGRKPGAFGGAGTGDGRRVASCVGEREMETAVDGMGSDILRGILSGEALD